MKRMWKKTVWLLALSLMAGTALPACAQDTESLVRNLVSGKGGNYLDDQLYISLAYNILVSTPKDMKTYSFPNTLSLGYIRDIPLNARRNIGLGAGIGLSYHQYYSNLAMTRDASGVPQIAMMESDEYKSSRFALQTLDIPIQVRFRGSTAERYDFWRVYAGVTVSWVIKDYATLNNGAFKVRYYNLPYLQNWLFTANLQVGYGKFTLRADYTLNPLCRSSRTGDIPGLGDTRSISLGLLVYIL